MEEKKADCGIWNRFKLSIHQKAAYFNGMNCRRLAVIVIFPCVLVHTGEGAHAADPTSRQATATATILPSVTTGNVTGGERAGKSRKSAKPGSKTIKYVDDEGFVTSAANPRRHPITITDLP